MSRYNDSLYYFIPLNEIKEEHMEFMSNSTIDTIRKSVRPIDGKIHAICSHSKLDYIPDQFKKYKGYTHQETLELIQSKEWNIYNPLEEFNANYDFDNIIELFENGNLIEAVSRMHISLFTLLNYKFYLFSFSYLNQDYKWKLFKSNKLEKANESTILLLNTFFDLITKDQHDQIDRFRIIRNNLCHSFERKFEDVEIKKTLNQMNDFVREELKKHP